MVTKHGLLKCRSVRRKPPGEQCSRLETVEARGTKWSFDVDMDTGISGPLAASSPDERMSTATTRGEIPTVPPPAPPPEEHVPEMRGQGVHAKALRIRAFWSEIGRTPGCPACETPGPGKSHTRECKTYQDAWDESRRTSSAEEAKRGIGDPDTRPLDPSGSSRCMCWPRRRWRFATCPTRVVRLHKHSRSTHSRPADQGRYTDRFWPDDNENLADRMDEDKFRRGPATSHQLEPVDDENVSKKARVARSVLHIRGEDNVKFDVNEEAWPNADLVFSSKLRRCLDLRTARRQSQGWRHASL